MSKLFELPYEERRENFVKARFALCDAALSFAILYRMRQFWIIFFCGLVIFFLPILGFPRVVNNAIYILVGLLLMALSLRRIRGEYVRELYDKTKDTP